jgi:hypothetical protein
MRSRSAILRILLSLVLVLNGIGGAMAAARMQLAPASHEHETGSRDMAGTDMPCHQQDAAAHPDHAMPSGDRVPEKAPAVPDCCKGAACTCACMCIAQAGLLAPALPALRWANLPVVKRLTSGHAAPALPHLVRPPIG